MVKYGVKKGELGWNGVKNALRWIFMPSKESLLSLSTLGIILCLEHLRVSFSNSKEICKAVQAIWAVSSEKVSNVLSRCHTWRLRTLVTFLHDAYNIYIPWAKTDNQQRLQDNLCRQIMSLRDYIKLIACRKKYCIRCCEITCSKGGGVSSKPISARVWRQLLKSLRPSWGGGGLWQNILPPWWP